MKKILIAYANAGAGHVKAAFAIERSLRKLGVPGLEVKIIDTLDYSTHFLKKGYPKTYLFAINKTPTFWGLGYYLCDMSVLYKAFFRFVRRANNFLNCGGLVRFLLEYKPDIVVNTHFLGAEVMSDMKRRGLMKETRLVTVVTDFFMHYFWIEDAVDDYCVAQEASKLHLISRGIPAEKIIVTGIPVDDVFSFRQDRKALCGKLNISASQRTVLIASGGFGVGPIKELVKELLRVEELQLLVVCGKNTALKSGIEDIARDDTKRVKVFGFVDNMDELMEASDVIVTKSGGLTSSEAMAKDLPMVITSAIPGQEARNCRFLVRAGVAVHAARPDRARRAILDILTTPGRLEQMKKNIQMIKKPGSSNEAARFVSGLL